MLSRTIVGVDLGGTKIHCGLIVGSSIVCEHSSLTPGTEDPSILVHSLLESIYKVFNDKVEGIGIGVPGIVDVENGIVRISQNLPAFKDFDLRAALEKELKVPVYLNNDANCFVVGEKYFGLCKGFDNIIGLTLGTGLGGGIVINGKLYSGKNCGAGDFSRIKHKEHDLEYYCSSQFFSEEYGTSGVDIYDSATKGDTGSIGILNEFGTNLGEAIHLLTLAFDPEIVVFGGSIAQAEAYLIEPIQKALKSFPNQYIIDKLKIVFSHEPNSALLGAAALFYDHKIKL